MDSTRDKIVKATKELMEAQGAHATGLSQILKESGAPKGSLYYYFPGGKDELIAEFIAQASQMMQQRLRLALAADPDPAVALRGFIGQLAAMIERSGYRSGGPLQMVALETATTNAPANLACRAAYQGLEGVVAEKLVASGWPPAQAEQLGLFVIAAIEGGVVLSRTRHSCDSLRSTGEQLCALIASSRPGQ